ncbi:hypothetical protein F0P94_03690 [Adhaeribacter soli]|uniref:DUF4177 domain-containing protein n=2 Tax=Adhaeribacter soli TaxID=2607655 RepID=A0A5N1J8M6_9BACT|nr:hypothetical protein F0P94_03690 [Adhaeribacter soli]
MKKIILSLLLTCLFLSAEAQNYEYKVVTIVESIVPMGIGRSRIIENKQALDANQFTTARTNGKNSKQDDVDRSDLKLDAFDETKLLNFYSAAGINFQNIASNDALITSKINTLTNEGWELAFTLSGVESDAGGPDGKGIYITRLIFIKKKLS